MSETLKDPIDDAAIEKELEAFVEGLALDDGAGGDGTKPEVESLDSSSEDEDVCTQYTYGWNDLIKCDFENWAADFAGITVPFVAIPIPKNVRHYLLQPVFKLPDGVETSSAANFTTSPALVHDPQELVDGEIETQIRRERNEGLELDEDSSSEEDELIDGVGNPPEKVTVPKFEEFDASMEEAFQLLGTVTPKVNWKAPTDANWIAFNTSLECYTIGDVYLLLKGSDKIGNILSDPFQGCSVPDEEETDDDNGFVHTLILRKWFKDWEPRMEFRCFIANNKLIAISQRDEIPYVAIKKFRETIVSEIHAFYGAYIFQKFELKYFTMDIVREKAGKILIMDFNVFGLTTNSLQFTYKDLLSIEQEPPETGLTNGDSWGHPVMRYYEAADGANDTQCFPHMLHGVPKVSITFIPNVHQT